MRYFLDSTILIKRLHMKDINRSVFSATGTAGGYLGSWQEPSPDKIQMYEGQIGKMFVCFLDISCPIQAGDKLIKDSITYSVRDIKINEFGSTHFKRVIVASGD